MSGKAVLIVGGSLAGIQQALEQAKTGNKVYLVEKFPTLICERIGVNGTYDPDNLFMSPMLEEVKNNENIQIITGAEVEKVAEADGKFKIKIKQRASRIIDELCDDCKACIAVCPVNLWDDANEQLSLRTAIDTPCMGSGIYNIVKDDMPICQATCPANLDIRSYLGLIADGKFEESLAVIRQRLPFPGIIGRICPHPCEQKCNRGLQDEPLSICGLKRFVADCELAEKDPKANVTAKAGTRPEKVAVVGGGPAGLTCAHDLAQLGYGVTIFEALPVLGGMLAVGIPDYRLPRELLEKEIDVVRALGVAIKTDTRIGKDITIDGLFKDGFKAMFIAVGAHDSQKLGIPGEEAEGVVDGVYFLRDVNLGQKVWVGENVAVIGGGNVAIDAARCALRLGAKKVSIIYRRSRQEMPASEEEIDAAEEENIDIQYLVAPVEVVSSNNKVKALKCTKMELGEPDASGRRRPVPVAGSEFDIELDMIIPAIGQVSDLSFLGDGSGVETTKRNTIAADAETLATTRPGVFTGGDAMTGPDIAIAAVAAGKRAAASIDNYLRGE
ncbi:MAG: FAD-dependent oxidoreductase [Chloroflexota bacterium]|nr:FAD-dependent oxidoreductase [Chloroflexota bacterium]